MGDEMWRWAGLGISLLGLAVIVATLVPIIRSRTRRGGRPGALAGLTPGERRRVLAQIRGRVPVDPRQRPLLRAAAGDLLAQRRLVVSSAGMMLVQVGQAVQHRSPVWTGSAVLVIALAGAGMALVRLDARRARRFLTEDAHRESQD